MLKSFWKTNPLDCLVTRKERCVGGWTVTCSHQFYSPSCFRVTERSNKQLRCLETVCRTWDLAVLSHSPSYLNLLLFVSEKCVISHHQSQTVLECEYWRGSREGTLVLLIPLTGAARATRERERETGTWYHLHMITWLTTGPDLTAWLDQTARATQGRREEGGNSRFYCFLVTP